MLKQLQLIFDEKSFSQKHKLPSRKDYYRVNSSGKSLGFACIYMFVKKSLNTYFDVCWVVDWVEVRV